MMDQGIIEKVLSKTATPEEARSVAAWLATDEGSKYFSQRYDRESYLLNEQLIMEWLDHDVPSKRMKTRVMSQLSMRVRTFKFRLVAAVLVPFLLMAAALTYIVNRSGVFQSEEMAEFVVPHGEQLNVILQDGTQVHLNSGSRLQYPRSFGFFKRKVTLSGEGYFSVASESARPFEVDLEDITIKVTGTQFNVKAYPDDKTILVALEEGSVNIADKSQKIYPMKAGQSAEYSRSTGKCNISGVQNLSSHTAWRTKSLNFYQTPLRDIIKTLERQYEIQFNVPDSTLLNYRFTLSTSKIDINDVLNDLEKVSKMKFKLNNNNKYTIMTLK
jgi:transmembrane sensor